MKYSTIHHFNADSKHIYFVFKRFDYIDVMVLDLELVTWFPCCVCVCHPVYTLCQVRESYQGAQLCLARIDYELCCTRKTAISVPSYSLIQKQQIIKQSLPYIWQREKVHSRDPLCHTNLDEERGRMKRPTMVCL